jgi:hypothetical protein
MKPSGNDLRAVFDQMSIDGIVSAVQGVMKTLLLGSCFVIAISANAALTRVDFETYPDGSPAAYGNVSTQWQSVGLILSSCGDDNAHLYNGVCTAQYIVHSGTHAVGTVCNTDSLQLSFAHSRSGKDGFVNEVGFWIEVGHGENCFAPVTSTFYDKSGYPFATNVASADPVGYRLANFYSVSMTNRRGISKIKISSSTYFLVDDVEFSRVFAIPWRFR